MATSPRSRRVFAVRIVATAAVLLLTGCAKEGISPQGQDVHRLFTIIMIIAIGNSRAAAESGE